MTSTESVPNLIGAADQPVPAHEFGELRVYWSEVANPETLTEGPTRRLAEQKYQNVLREIVTHTTPIALPFPAVVSDLESVDALLVEQRDHFIEALDRLIDTVQYEMTATWTDEGQADLATPVRGREYQKRRQKAEARIAAIDTKLKTVTGGIVREWRSRQHRRKHLWFALVSRDDRERFLGALRSAGPSEGVRIRLSGPWPPSEFLEPSSK